MPRPKNVEIRRRIAELWDRGFRSPGEIAEKLGIPYELAWYYLKQMRKEGILPSADPTGDLLEAALAELKQAAIMLAYIRFELRESKLLPEVAKAEGAVERAAQYIAAYRRLRA